MRLQALNEHQQNILRLLQQQQQRQQALQIQQQLQQQQRLAQLQAQAQQQAIASPANVCMLFFPCHIHVATRLGLNMDNRAYAVTLGVSCCFCLLVIGILRVRSALQRMTPLQALQMQLQLQQQLGRQQQQMAGQQNFGAAAGNGLERFFNANTMTAAQRAAAMPAQVHTGTCRLHADDMLSTLAVVPVHQSARSDSFIVQHPWNCSHYVQGDEGCCLRALQDCTCVRGGCSLQAGARPTHEELERRFNAPH